VCGTEAHHVDDQRRSILEAFETRVPMSEHFNCEPRRTDGFIRIGQISNHLFREL